jgi:hypothetical protein
VLHQVVGSDAVEISSRNFVDVTGNN